MQLMLGIYEFERGGTYPKEFVVDYVRSTADTGAAPTAAPPGPATPGR
jgi:hypothetical protein